MRKFLDRIYLVSAGLSAALIAGICLLETAQVVANLATKLGGKSVNLTIPSYADFSGFFLAASSFLALAYTLRSGKHIRVTLLSNILPKRGQLFMELFALVCAATVALSATYFMALLSHDSYSYGDLSAGIVAVPLFLPQVVATFGLLLLSVSLIDTFVETLRAGAPVIMAQEM